MLYTEWFGKLFNWQKTWQGLYSHLHIRKLLKLLQLKMHMEGLYNYVHKWLCPEIGSLALLPSTCTAMELLTCSLRPIASILIHRDKGEILSSFQGFCAKVSGVVSKPRCRALQDLSNQVVIF